MSLGERLAGGASAADVRAAIREYRESTIQVIELTLYGAALFLIGLNVGIRYAWHQAFMAEYTVPAMFGSNIPADARVWTDPLFATASDAFWGAVAALLVLVTVGWIADRWT